MKKLGLLAMALALALTMTQCKKENTNASNDEGVKVSITLNVSCASTGLATGISRVAVDGSTGVVTFENGDVLHVVSNGVYVGSMTYNGTVFSGEINEPTEGQKLQFYFLGNKTPVFNTDNTGCSVVISNQTEYLPVISYAPSRENYQVGKTDYNATLLNKCALVKFDVTTGSEAATCILGMNNKVMVYFTTNEFIYSQEGEGVITLPAGSGERWAILLPQNEVTDVQARSEDGAYTGTCAAIPSIADNDYLTECIAVAIETSVGPVGISNGAFTINAHGDPVCFSQGNLQYQASTNTWRFAENQWDYVGTQTPDYFGNVYGTISGSDNANISSTYNGWIDLFGWGTSGYNHGAVCYQPWSTSGNYLDYYDYGSDYYAYGNYAYNLYDQTGQADWGYNAISNGGNTANSGWHTLTNTEWHYIFYERNSSSGIRYAYGNVNGVNGVILLPDNWSDSIYTLNNVNSNNSYYVSFNSNVISASQWDVFEAAGAVFLPCAGYRKNFSVYSVGSEGYYWSASIYFYDGDDYFKDTSDGGALSVHIYLESPWSMAWLDTKRCTGRSVRLVRNIE